MITFWLWRDGSSTRMWWIMGVAVVGNVSLMLYSRQCRYCHDEGSWDLALQSEKAHAKIKKEP